MKSLLVKRTVLIDGHKTSVCLEDQFWSGLKDIARAKQITVSELVTEIDRKREQSNLASTIRLFVLHHFRSLANVQVEHRQADVAQAHTK